MNNNLKLIVLKIVCLIVVLSGCLFLFSSCSTVSEMVYGSDDEEKACQYTYQTYGEFMTDEDGYHSFVNVITIDDDSVKEDEILIDVISNVDNGIVSINYGGSYDEGSIKMYSPVTNFKLSKGGIYYLAINIDRGNGGDSKDLTGWVGISKCFEKGKHYVVFYGDDTSVLERYGK